MDASSFDDLARNLVMVNSRRGFLAGATAGFAAVLGPGELSAADAKGGCKGKGGSEGKGKGCGKRNGENERRDKNKENGKGKGKGNEQPMIGVCRGDGNPCEGNQICCDGLDCTTSGPGSTDRCTSTNDDAGVDALEFNAAIDKTPTAAPDSAAQPVAGTGEVRVAGCEIAEAREQFDWHVQCLTPLSGATFSLSPLGDNSANSELAGTTNDAGTLYFEQLIPGTYMLNRTDGNWCFAESNGVDEHGNVVVEADDLITVWIFVCATP